MSYGTYTAAMLSIEPAEARHMAFTLNLFRNLETGECWPSQETLAKTAAMHPANVRRALRSLEHQRIIKRVGVSKSRTTIYVIDPIFIHSPGTQSPSIAASIETASRKLTTKKKTRSHRSVDPITPIGSTRSHGSVYTDHTDRQQDDRQDDMTRRKTTGVFVAAKSDEAAVGDVVSSVEEIATKVKKIAKKKPERTYHPEAFGIVDFFATLRAELLPTAAVDQKFRFATRTVADRLLKRASVAEVKQRILRMRANIPDSKPNLFASLAQLEHQWDRWGPGREEAARLAGFQAKLPEIAPVVASVPDDVLAEIRERKAAMWSSDRKSEASKAVAA